MVYCSTLKPWPGVTELHHLASLTISTVEFLEEPLKNQKFPTFPQMSALSGRPDRKHGQINQFCFVGSRINRTL